MHRLLIGTILILMHLATDITAQESDDTDFQTWLDYKGFYQMTDKVQWEPDLGIRGVISNEDWNQIFIRPALLWQNKAWLQLHGGIGSWYTWEKSVPNTFELRPWQGVKVLWPKPVSFAFNHFLRLEERMELTPAWNFTLRMRYRIGVKTPNLVLHSMPDHPFYSTMSFELFINLNKAIEERFVNRNRLTLNVGNHVAKDWRFEIELIRQASKRGSEEGFKTSEVMLRFRVKHNLESRFFAF